MSRGAFGCVLALVVLVAVFVATLPAGAASSGTVIGAVVPSATTIDVDECKSGTAGVTHFGSVLPEAKAVTTADCVVKFGSSNNTSTLLMRQSDGRGVGMWRPTLGTLDEAFDGPLGGGNGAFVDPIGTDMDAAFSIATDTQGRLVVAGACEVAGVDEVCLARYLADGSRDPGFDGPGTPGNGSFIDDLAAGEAEARSMLIQPDGRIVIAGFCSNGSNHDFCLARYLANGSRDPSFDGPSGTGNGYFLDPIGSSTDRASNIVLLPDGRLLVAGYCTVAGQYETCLTRYLPNGARDPSFDGPSGSADGAFIQSFTPDADVLDVIALQPDGRFVAAGGCNGNGTDLYDFCVARFNSDGSLDVSFDGPSGSANGWFSHSLVAKIDIIFDIAIDPDGRIVAVGMCDDVSTAPGCAARYLPNGDFDPTFDGPSGTGDGRIKHQFTMMEMLTSVDVQPDGKTVFGGSCMIGPMPRFDMCLIRVDETGQLDVTFDGPSGSGNGIASHSVGSVGMDIGWTMTPLDDGDIALVGICNTGVNGDFCITRFGAVTVPQYANGVSDWDTASPNDGAFAACLQGVSGGASADWTVDGNASCTAVDTDPWEPVPETATAIAHTSALEPNPVDAAAHLRFGLRVAASQAPGSYVAPITFEVVAP